MDIHLLLTPTPVATSLVSTAGPPIQVRPTPLEQRPEKDHSAQLITRDSKQQVGINSHGSLPSPIKRATSQTPRPEESPAQKQSKWTPEEDNLNIELRGQAMKWDDIAKRLPGRSPTSCRLRYQNYLEKRGVWDEEQKNKLARFMLVLKLGYGRKWQLK